MFEFKNQKKEEVKNEYKAPEKMLLEPKEVTIKGCKFVISKMPCLAAQEVIIRIGSGIIPLINQYAISEDMVIKMLSCCQRVYDDKPNVPLISKDIINNHIPDFEVLIQLENECLKYNYDFFAQGRLLDFLNKGLSLAESKLSKILTDLLDKLLLQEKQH